MKNRFLNEGLSNFEPHNVLELLLFYSQPQKDTNETAHLLIERFGSLKGVFDAPFEKLIEVPGIKEHSATLIKLIPALAQRYIEESNDISGEILSSISKIGEYFKAKYIGVTSETVYLLLLDNKFKLISCVKMHEGSVNSAAITPRKLVETAMEKKASMAVLAHNHPSGLPIPSPDDLITTNLIRNAFDTVGITLLAHILVAGDRYTNILNRYTNILKG